MRIFIVGVSCVGKSAIGFELSKLQGCQFFDLDDEIEKFFSMPIERLQEQYLTMDSFRKEGARVLASLLNRDSTKNDVIALPPSGLMGHYWNVVKKAEGLKMVLKDKPENILDRIVFYDKDSKEIQKEWDAEDNNYYLREIRKDIQYFGRSYRRADITLDVSGLDIYHGALAAKNAVENFLTERSSSSQMTTAPEMTQDHLLNILGELPEGQLIPGTVAGKCYRFKGIRKYSGRGKYADFNGVDVVILESEDRKRPIVLFLEPLRCFANSDSRDLDFGRLPANYIKKYRSGEPNHIPNLFEYESHYKSLARFIQSSFLS